MNIRVAYRRVPAYMEADSSSKLSGPFGNLYSSLYQKFLRNFTFVAFKGNETQALFDALQRGDADILFAPIDYGTGPSFLRPTPQVGAQNLVASHAPTLSATYQDIMAILNIYSFEVLLLLFISVVVTGITLLIINPTFGLLGSLTKVGQCLLNQSNMSPSAIRTRALILFWFIVSFVVMEVYEQAMNADMIVTDYSSIVESLEDLNRHKLYRPVFLEDLISEQFKLGLDPVKQRIWKRPNRYVMEMSLSGMVHVGKLNDVHIGMHDGVVASTEFFCGMTSEKANNLKYLIGTKGFGVVNYAFHYRGNVTNETSQFIDHKSLYLAEGGHVPQLFKQIGRFVSQSLPKSTPACICYSKEELYDDFDTLRPIAIKNISRFFGLIRLMLGLVILAFVFEKLGRLFSKAMQYII